MKKIILFLFATVATTGLFAQGNNAAQAIINVYKPDTVHKFGAYTNTAYLLKKMDGFEIGDDGTVFHQGRQVNLAKINGVDYIGVDVAKAIRQIPADKVQNIEVIEGMTVKMKGGKTSGPQKVLSILFTDEGPFYIPGEPGMRQRRTRDGRMVYDSYTANYADPNLSNPRNQLDRNVDRAIRNTQAATNSLYEVDDYGDRIPHFLIKDWPGPGKPKVKKDKKDAEVTTDVKPVQP